MIDKIDASQLNLSDSTPEFPTMPGFPAPPGVSQDPSFPAFPAPPGSEPQTSLGSEPQTPQTADPIQTTATAAPEDPVEKENKLSNEKDNINI
jgi:hypothetical protein